MTHGIHIAFDGAPTDALSGSTILEDLISYISRFVVLTPAQATICAVYVLHTHTFAASEFTPYLSVNSAVMRSGKTRLLEVLRLFVNKPWLTGRVSPAVLVRKTAKQTPTLLLDESDTAFAAEKEYAEALRGILNSGFQRGGCASVCVKKNGDWEPQDFPTFSPKVIAGIGVDKLPGTVRDRSISITLKRKMRGEVAARHRAKREYDATQGLRDRIAAWASMHVKALREAQDPPFVEGLNDRQQDVCDPLLQIARLIGGVWPGRLEKALKQVCAESSDESIGTQLLADTRVIFDEAKTAELATTDIIAKLGENENSPWADWNRGKGLTPHSLARLFRDFKVSAWRGTVAGERFRGYRAADLADAWERYLPPSHSVTLPFPGSEVGKWAQASVYASETLFSKWAEEAPLPTLKSEESSMNTRVLPTCPLQSPGIRKKISSCGTCGSFALYRAKDGTVTCQTCELRNAN